MTSGVKLLFCKLTVIEIGHFFQLYDYSDRSIILDE